MSRQTFTVYARSLVRRSCKACRAPIEFYQNAETERWIPFDPGADIKATFQRQRDGIVCHEIEAVAHFATCPKADEFRKKKAPAEKPVERTLF